MVPQATQCGRICRRSRQHHDSPGKSKNSWINSQQPARAQPPWTSTPQTCPDTPTTRTTPTTHPCPTPTLPSSSEMFIFLSRRTVPHSQILYTTSIVSAVEWTASSLRPRTAVVASAAAVGTTHQHGHQTTTRAARGMARRRGEIAPTQNLMHRGGESFCQRSSACPSPLALSSTHRDLAIAHSLCHAHIHLDKCFLLDQCDELVTGCVPPAPLGCVLLLPCPPSVLILRRSQQFLRGAARYRQGEERFPHQLRRSLR